jgi:NADPH-dependent glutamate synthase beta subunit-like oxidoreductase
MTESAHNGVSRRRILYGTAAVGAAALLPVPSARAAAGPKRRVAVLGGGMSGLAAAHELVDRGFEGTVFER